MLISLAPLQGLTEYPFRNALHRIIGGVDKFYSPFLRLENDGSIRSKYLKDIAQENNKNINLIPQILVNNAKDFLKLAVLIEEQGYDEVNWNLGCPYPMVAKRKLGSGLLSFPNVINEILTEVCKATSLNISIKLRSGYLNNEEINKVIPVLNQYPIKELIYHPRVGKQLYKGEASINDFLQVTNSYQKPIAYNGDITSSAWFDNTNAVKNETSHFMIGRGLISNPFLATELKQNKALPANEKQLLFEAFYDELFMHYSKSLSGDTHILNKLLGFWEYFNAQYVNGKKVYKTLKKCKSLSRFQAEVHAIIQNEEMQITQ